MMKAFATMMLMGFGILAPTKVKEISVYDFLDLQQSSGTFVVSLGAPWCPPCNSYKPVFEVVANIRSDVNFLHLNLEKDCPTEVDTTKYGCIEGILAQQIMSNVLKEHGWQYIPATFILQDGKILRFKHGPMNGWDLNAFIGK